MPTNLPHPYSGNGTMQTVIVSGNNVYNSSMPLPPQGTMMVMGPSGPQVASTQSVYSNQLNSISQATVGIGTTRYPFSPHTSPAIRVNIQEGLMVSCCHGHVVGAVTSSFGADLLNGGNATMFIDFLSPEHCEPGCGACSDILNGRYYHNLWIAPEVNPSTVIDQCIALLKDCGFEDAANKLRELS